ncbi:MAG: NAD(+)/NADH kinase [Treponema sp.]|nr:NAD(+)/NADH kinase [Treponema sp.]
MNDVTRIAIVCNPRKEAAGGLAERIRERFEGEGARVGLFDSSEEAVVPESRAGGEWHLAFSLGGDGTVLRTARAFAPGGTALFPVNLGKVGFLAWVPPAQWEACYDAWRAAGGAAASRMMLEARVLRDGARAEGAYCLNEAAVVGTGPGRILDLRARVQDAVLSKCRADGLIVAGPAGSTAWALSAGGPVLDPALEALAVVPICPFGKRGAPILLPAGLEVTVEQTGDKQQAASLVVDGQLSFPLRPGDKVSVRRAPFPCRIVTQSRGDFYKALEEKL